MKTIEVIRTENLRLLLEKHGYAKVEADTGKARSQISRWANNNKTANGKPSFISNDSCREIEEKMKLPERWMDIDHSPPVRKEGYVPVVSWVAAGRWSCFRLMIIVIFSHDTERIHRCIRDDANSLCRTARVARHKC